MANVSTAPHVAPPQIETLLWDVFCRVIDNHGDLGVCWRLSAQLGALGHQVRLWVDDESALAWMAPQGAPGVQVRAWALSSEPAVVRELPVADVWIEAFGCEIEPNFIAETINSISDESKNNKNFPVWINVEYLTAEPYALRCHGLPSPVLNGPAAGQVKRFYYPGFAEGTGGLLREPDLERRQQSFDRKAWLSARRVPWQGERLISLFCYEPPALPHLLQQLARQDTATRLLVTPGRPAQAVHQAMCAMGWQATGQGQLQVSPLTYLPQTGFDELLWACDLNFVRGEDSLVRALWAGKPLIWQIYPQEDGAHWPKLHAFLHWLQAPPDVWEAHQCWNSGQGTAFQLPDAQGHRQTAVAALARLRTMQDLVSQLLASITEWRR